MPYYLRILSGDGGYHVEGRPATDLAIRVRRHFGYRTGRRGRHTGILIPPSVILVIYELITETPIRELFAARFLSGRHGIPLDMAAVKYVVWRDPSPGPAAPRRNWAERMLAL